MTVLLGPFAAFPVATLLQQFRDRTSIFFMFALPVIIMVIVGSTFGGAAEIEIGVAGATNDQLDRITDEAESIDSVVVVPLDSADSARRAIRRFDIEGALIFDQSTGTVGFVTDETSAGAIGVQTVAQRLVDQASVSAGAPDLAVTGRVVGENEFADKSPFSLTAAQNLVLFTFITALTAGVIVVRVRRNGVLRRSISTSAGFASVAIGLMAAWFFLALLQSLIIGLVGVFFGVQWGSPAAGLGLLVVFALVGAGAGLLVGSLFPTEDLVGSVGPPLALVLAALGGCMVPPEVFPPTIATISRFTPHYWALEGWRESIFRDGSFVDVLPHLGVLSAYAAGLIGLAVLALRREVAS